MTPTTPAAGRVSRRAAATAFPAAARAYGFALLLVGAASLVRLGLNAVWGARIPYLPFFPAVLVAALYGGLGPDLLATALSTGAVILLVLAPVGSPQIANPVDVSGLFGFVAVSLMIMLVSSSQRTARVRAEESAAEAQRANDALRDAERRQRTFLREMLFAMTEGRLRLCDTADDLPPPFPESAGETVTLTRPSLRLLRRQVMAAAEAAGLPVERAQDVETGVGEAGMNAVVHAGGGTGRVTFAPDAGRVQVRVTDHGRGISEGALHRATLERGYSSAGTLGHGFWMMLKTCDAVYLLTGPTGTTVVLEQGRTAPPPHWARLD
jgi:anti-sigma regulatory factor (Ser/Thr protein kinase)